MSHLRPLAIGLFAASLLLAPPVSAQTKGAEQTRDQKPVYPEELMKALRQGNVLLVGRIDTTGRLTDLRMVGASHKDFIQPAVDAVRAWQFQPATRDGKPVEIFANIAVRFRLEGDKHGYIDAPILGDLAISPADASGKRTAPEGFPIRLGLDPAVRAEAQLDVPPVPQARTLTVHIDATSPSGKKVVVYQPPVAVPANATEVRIPVVVNIGPDWEEGVWGLRFTVNGAGAGRGQFWLARDPAHFAFVIPKS